MTTIITVGGQKGGTGKSNIVCHLSAALANNGYSVTILDADKQRTAADWCFIRETERKDRKAIDCIQSYGDITNTIYDITSDYCIIDTAGHDSEELRCALIATKLFISPFNASVSALRTLPAIVDVISAARKFNPSLTAFAVLSIAPTNVLMNNNALAKQLFSEYPELTLCESIIYNRAVYDNCMEDGLGVCEGKGGSANTARQEIEALMQEVINA
jgi:chromosome partitioning protein